MAKPEITAIAENFEQMVGAMHAQMVQDRAKMLGGIDLSSLGVSHNGDNHQVAAAPVGDMSKDTLRTV